ncbi:MAG: MATE family efflux transporter [Syntrophomonadaceae bacterium]|jgi:putative MATE family efflux protein|nr:MATE family efflux transporter [Syntrophomonadaceae bacterium]
MLNQGVAYLLARLSLPAMLGMILFSMFSLADTWFVARLGPDHLAALTLVIPVQVLITSMASATGVGVTSLIGRALGRGQRAYADNSAWHGLGLSIIYGVLLPLLGLAYIDELLYCFGCSSQILLMSKGYMQILLIGAVFTFVPIILCSVIQGEGNTLLPVLISLAGIISNVILDPIFIFGIGPVKAMGLNGAALAGVLAQVLATALAGILVIQKKHFLSWSWANFDPSSRVLLAIYKVGFPTLVMELAGVLVMGYMNRILAGFSFTAVAALGIFLRIRSMMYMPVFGLVQAAMPIAAFAFGAGNHERVKETIIKASLTAFVFMSAAWYIMQFHPLSIIQYFSHDPALTILGVNCMRLATVFIPLIGPVLILNTVLQGVGRGFTAMFLSLCRQLGFFLPLLIILPPQLGLNGVWLAFSISELLAAILAFFIFVHLWQQLQNRPGRLPLFTQLGWLYFFQRLYTWLKWR